MTEGFFMIGLRLQSKILITPTLISDVFVLETKVLSDERGWFTESFNSQDFSYATGLNINFVQDNHSFSRQFTLRGMHYQTEWIQSKLVRVLSGVIFDVVVDLRKDSTTYSKWVGVELSAENHKQLLVPGGFAHGFLVLSKSAEILYKTTDYYHPKSEVCLAWNDPTIAIEWPLFAHQSPILNAKDSAGLSWDQAPKF